MAYVIPDPRFEMPELFEPGRKPTGPVEIDWDHHIGHMCIQALVTKDKIDLATGLKYDEAGTNINNRGSVEFVTDNDGDGLINKKLTTKNAKTIIVSFQEDSSGAQDYAHIAASKETFFSDTNGFLFQLRTSQTINFYGKDSSFDTGLSIGKARYSKNVIAITFEGSTGDFYVDGNLVDTHTITAPITNQTKTRIARGSYSTENSFKGVVHYYYEFDCVLKPEQIKNLFYSPYQFLIPA